MSVKAEINVTPLVDVVLVLLIIFMVVAPQLESGATVTLPVASNPDKDAPGALQPLTVSLTKDGVIYFDKEQLDRAALETRLTQTHASSPEQKVVLKADQAAGYGAVRSLFKLCQGIGFPGVSLQVIDRANQKG